MSNNSNRNKEKRLLFILKKRSNYGVSYGLANSCKFISNALREYGIKCKIVEVNDNNCIDREVWLYKPTHVSIDALWVVPQKFNILLKKYPKVKWNVRIHSKIPFLANEGIAMQWLYGYQDVLNEFDNFSISANAYVTTMELKSIGIYTRYLPNIYYPNYKEYETTIERKSNIIDIGCFGAVRPLKNTPQQAISAIIFADDIGKKIRFNINCNRVEQHGEPILKNLEYLFKNTRHELVKHNWMNHEDFLKVVSKMELGMQVSYSESFNIVAADFVYNNVPIVGSPDIEWLSKFYQADPNNHYDIVEKLHNAYNHRNIGVHSLNKFKLWKHNKESIMIWLDYIYEED